MDIIEILRKLTLASGISGYETEVAAILQAEMPDKINYSRDRMGNLDFHFPGTEDTPVIQFIAHLDEIGFIVSDITEEGFLRLQPIGGWDPHILPATPLRVINSESREYYGVIVSVPIHYQNREAGNQQPGTDDFSLDVGADSHSRVVNDFGISLGDPVVPCTNFHYQPESGRVFSKALDDRVGIAALLAIAEILPEMNHPSHVVLTGSVQEEVGARGALSLSRRSKADICIVLEGAPADDVPGIRHHAQTALGKGVHIRLYDPHMLVKRELSDFLIKLAAEKGIPYQPAVRKRGGTDGMHIHTANIGIPTIVLGVPVRYTHTPHSQMCLSDFQHLIEFLAVIIQKLDTATLAGILRT
ncbi:MAG: M20/M25/M40 family metallo-hydrolase [Candidatus Cloacimonetes bacterium]|nr:M20/M25/M40 family metallo-hydrolase [Candidatus Cloacimonadota bacterium]